LSKKSAIDMCMIMLHCPEHFHVSRYFAMWFKLPSHFHPPLANTTPSSQKCVLNVSVTHTHTHTKH